MCNSTYILNGNSSKLTYLLIQCNIHIRIFISSQKFESTIFEFPLFKKIWGGGEGGGEDICFVSKITSNLIIIFLFQKWEITMYMRTQPFCLLEYYSLDGITTLLHRCTKNILTGTTEKSSTIPGGESLLLYRYKNYLLCIYLC